jgi:hypothetical protein
MTQTITNDNFLAKTFDNILTQSEIDNFLNYCYTTDKWAEIPNNFWDKRTIDFSIIKSDNPSLAEILEKAVKNIQSKLVENYNIPDVPCADTISIVRWFPGMKQTPHCDDMSDSKDHSKFSHRYFGCVIYLNNNYTGGETYYPKHNVVISPKPGMAAVHLGDCNHRHGVTQVEKNIRYTIASFWGFDKNKAIKTIDWNR